MEKHPSIHLSKTTKIGEIFQIFPQKSQRFWQCFTQAGLKASQEILQDTLETSVYKIGKKEDAVEKLLKKLDEVIHEKEEGKSSAISLTERAALQLKMMMENEGKSNWILKFAEISGHCGGGSGYALHLDQYPDPQDKIFYSRGIQICVPKKCLKKLLGSLIHYEESPPNELFDGLLKNGFAISNPNVKGPCACSCQKGYTF